MSRRATTPTGRTYSRLAKEADIQLGIRELLTYMGVPHSVTDASRAWDQAGKVTRAKVDQGWPDLSGVIPFAPRRGVALFVETKSASGGYQPGQRECHEMLMAAGAVVIVPRSIPDFARKMIEQGIEHKLLKQVLKG